MQNSAVEDHTEKVDDYELTDVQDEAGNLLPMVEQKAPLLAASPAVLEQQMALSSGKRRRRRLKKAAFVCLFIVLWFSFSLALSVVNKWMFSEDQLNFRFPLFMSSSQMVIDWPLVGCISVITVGVALMVATEAQFALSGFLLVLASSVMSGLRWSITQLYLLDHPATSNSFTSLAALTPFMFLFLVCSGLVLEGPNEFIHSPLWATLGWRMSMLFVFPGVLAFVMISAEFGLIKKTGIVTLSVCGIIKEIITILFSSFYFHDKLLPINFVGLVIAIFGIAIYNMYRYFQSLSGDDSDDSDDEPEEENELQEESEEEPLHSSMSAGQSHSRSSYIPLREITHKTSPPEED
ncbi:membrane transporter [Schizosaccharomyces japonicus yFS275]|uniref:Membrane transporter n=1 Tax=Schizosaccharomyces japonicus (strain yFS275 / FY16936) TaxID=402676 RepID=B6K6R8_SCHJY|nr:membrane transporter [Schizosaccharomyces japonicus yFS275]EEB09222.1 membrane transporter [Schizosaccharomyces japonicus yFS275]